MALFSNSSYLAEAMFRLPGKCNSGTKPEWFHSPLRETGGIVAPKLLQSDINRRVALWQIAKQVWTPLSAADTALSHRISLCIGTGQQIAEQRDKLLMDIFTERLAFDDIKAFKARNRAIISQVFFDFFGAVTRGLPGIVWVEPYYYSRTRPQVYKTVEITPAVIGQPERRSEPMIFRFGDQKGSFQLKLETSNLLMKYTDDKRRMETNYFTMGRSRYGMSLEGKPFCVHEENLGLATQDDFDFQDSGKGFHPAVRMYKTVVGNSNRYLFRVLSLARLRMEERGLVRVDHLILTFDPVSSLIVDISTYVRDFSVFLEHYGISDVLYDALKGPIINARRF